MAIEAGDVVTLDGVGWRIVEVSLGSTIAFDAVRAGEGAGPVRRASRGGGLRRRPPGA